MKKELQRELKKLKAEYWRWIDWNGGALDRNPAYELIQKDREYSKRIKELEERLK